MVDPVVWRGETEKLRARFEERLRETLPGPAVAGSAASTRHREAMAYSLHDGGKRFRPLLAFAAGEALGLDFEEVFPWAAAVEMIHTYSLIHDDLPCMDNDDVRRGRPTNHRRFDEATALLAGDALLTDVFGFLAETAGSGPHQRLELIRLLSEAAGSRGMIGGQVMDLYAEEHGSDLPTLEKIHDLKTGCLIRVAIEGAAVLAEAESPVRESLVEFGFWLGRSFQIADDLLDAGGQGEKGKSYVELLGLEKSKTALLESSSKARAFLRETGLPAAGLERLIDYNLERLL